MEKTTLKLLTRDGAIAVTFDNALTPEQYEAVYDCVRLTSDANEMRKRLELMASEWGAKVTIEAAI